VTSSWFFLSTLNYDARSTTHQIYRIRLKLVQFLACGDSNMHTFFVGNYHERPIPVAKLRKAWVCGRSPAEIVGSNPSGAWIFVHCEWCMLSGRGLCDELITRPKKSYRLWWVIVCDLETSSTRWSCPALGRSATRKKKN